MAPSTSSPAHKKLPPKPKYKEESHWVGLVFGWAFIFMSLAVIYYMVSRSKPEGRLVCDRAMGASLTSFGSCHKE